MLILGCGRVSSGYVSRAIGPGRDLRPHPLPQRIREPRAAQVQTPYTP